mmetsp:Transcript_50911/g.75479  ORF Transcript_50911/g.75479 Transcript_50911/m.75479 type:complete len:202 (+) Transcript_50911:133-738(+)
MARSSATSRTSSSLSSSSSPPPSWPPTTDAIRSGLTIGCTSSFFRCCSRVSTRMLLMCGRVPLRMGSSASVSDSSLAESELSSMLLSCFFSWMTSIILPTLVWHRNKASKDSIPVEVMFDSSSALSKFVNGANRCAKPNAPSRQLTCTFSSRLHASVLYLRSDLSFEISSSNLSYASRENSVPPMPEALRSEKVASASANL